MTDFPGSGRGAGGGRGHSREVWVELCLRGEIVHFATQFKTLFHDPELFRLAYRIEYFFFNTYIKELDFLKEIVGSTHVARSSPTFTPKKHPFQHTKSEIVYPVKELTPYTAAAHTLLGQIGMSPSADLRSYDA